MSAGLRIGIDFDNTIITYDDVFLATARERGLVGRRFYRPQAGDPRCRPVAVRMANCHGKNCKVKFTVKASHRRSMFEGVDAFLRRCRLNKVPVVIVSHKTEFGHHDPDRVNLRDAARDWMTEHGFFSASGFGIAPDAVYFEATRQDKLARIAQLGCTHFIDDLEEVLSDPAFPPGVERILFTEGRPASAPYIVCPTWRHIEEQVFHARR